MAYPMTRNLLKPSKWARPRIRLKGVDAIVWHWVANPNSTAAGNRNFFNNRTGSYGSAHYIIGLQGEQLHVIPDNEMAYHVGSTVYTSRSRRELGSYPNNNTLGIECTHVDWTGRMTKATYDSLIDLTVKLLKKYKLTVDDIWLHQEVVGWKDCHRYFVNNLSEYRKAKNEVAKRMNQTVKNKVVKINPQTDTDMVKTDSKGEYIVQKGDTFWAIARALNTTVATLEKLNPNVKPTALKIGSKIKVSDGATTSYKEKLAEDGYWGVQTSRELQIFFDTVVDGEIWGQYPNQATRALTCKVKHGPPYGSPVIKALQRKVGAKADGVLGPATVQAMQRHLGTPVDGEIWRPSTMVKTLQRRLNNGDL